MLINSAVCEGCGDCGVQSNCLSVVPLETPYGRKRAIDQSSCNKDYSCAEGFCPSFVSVMGGKPRKSAAPKADQERLQQLIAQLPAPAPAGPAVPPAGGGHGRHRRHHHRRDHFHGRAPGRPVCRRARPDRPGAERRHRGQPHPPGAGRRQPGPVRLDWQQADAAILCDPVASVAPDSLGALRHGHTQVTVNTYVAPVSEFTRNPDAAMRPEALLAKIRHAAGDAHTAAIDAHAAALALFGDSILSNMFMLGYAWQRGGVPLSHAAINRAIELNGVAVAANRAAFDSGRLAAHQPDALSTALRPRAQVVQLHVPESFEHAVARRLADLTAYQDADYARQYQDVVERVAARERELAPDAKPRLALAVARSLFKLMAYKDEYEVARLYTGDAFRAQLQDQFEGEYSLRFHMAPPIFARKDPRTGVPRKMTLGPRTMTALKLLARFACARHLARPVRPDRRTQDGTRPDRRVPPDRGSVARRLERGQARTGGHHRRPRGNGTRLRPREGRERREVPDRVGALDAKLYGACASRHAPAQNRVNTRSHESDPGRALLGAPSAFRNNLLEAWSHLLLVAVLVDH